MLCSSGAVLVRRSAAAAAAAVMTLECVTDINKATSALLCCSGAIQVLLSGQESLAVLQGSESFVVCCWPASYYRLLAGKSARSVT